MRSAGSESNCAIGRSRVRGLAFLERRDRAAADGLVASPQGGPPSTGRILVAYVAQRFERFPANERARVGESSTDRGASFRVHARDARQGAHPWRRELIAFPTRGRRSRAGWDPAEPSPRSSSVATRFSRPSNVASGVCFRFLRGLAALPSSTCALDGRGARRAADSRASMRSSRALTARSRLPSLASRSRGAGEARIGGLARAIQRRAEG
jgi:hypothetical protein